MKTLVLTAAALALVLGQVNNAYTLTPEETLGKSLYFDKSLSNPPGQSCASCHHPKSGWSEPHNSLPVSEGVIKGRFGTRNSPSSAYAAFSPELYFDGELWIGGQFWDGREKDLEGQAKGPFLNSLEMNNTKEGVIKAVRKSDYADLFRRLYGHDSLQNIETAYEMVAQAIAAYERTKRLNNFSSKYDCYLLGKASLTPKEKKGLRLFNDPTKGNCAACHPSSIVNGQLPLFTDFSYDNLGIPKNTQIEALKGQAVPVDYGLGATVGPQENGKFKVMTLRNIADTAPYGHNGYFATLQDIVHFYNTRDVQGAGWAPPEVEENVNSVEMGNLQLTRFEENAIVAFLQALSDGYECVPERVQNGCANSGDCIEAAAGGKAQVGCANSAKCIAAANEG